MKALYISHHLKGNDGWSRYARDIARAVKAEGVDVLCLVNEYSAETADIEQKACLGQPLLYVANPLHSLRAARAINRAIREFKPDVIQFVVEPYGTSIPFLRTRGAKIVLNAHSTFAYMPILVHGLRRLISIPMTCWTYARVSSAVCISRFTEGHLLRHMSSIGARRLVEGKITIIGGGVDLAPIHPRTQPKPANARKEILFAAALKPRKGVMEAVEALALVKMDFIFRLVGWYRADDPYVMAVQKKIAEYGLQDKIILTGRVSDDELRKLYQDADLYFMPSTNNGADFEGYGLVYIEASAYGVPCIGPSDSGVSDAIVDGTTGYLVDQFDYPTVAKKIEHVLRDRPISSADCIAWARKCSIANRGKATVALYNKLLSCAS